MISVYGNSLVGAYNYGQPVRFIYNSGVMCWPSYYIIWSPSSLNGTFSIDGVTYNMSDCNGFFSSFSGTVTTHAFMNTGIVTLETNAVDLEEYAFAGCPSLLSVSLSQCSSIGYKAFWSCNNILDVYAPECLYVSDSGLGRLSNAQSIYIPKCSYIGDYGLYYNSSLTSISLSVCSYLGASAFCNCLLLSSISLPVCTYVSSNAFRNCTSLSSISLPQCSVLENNVFNGCTLLSSVSLPLCESIGAQAFSGCTALSVISLPVCSFLNFSCFYGMSSLTVYLGYSDVVRLTSLSTFIDITTLKIYVPESLYDSYMASQSWSRYWSNIYTGDYYISWTPIDTSGTFYGGRLENYSGYYEPRAYYIPEDGFRSATFTSIETTVTELSSNAFRNCLDLRTANILSCVLVGGSAFRNCLNLNSISAPECTYISMAAFFAANLKELDLPKVETIEDYAFADNFDLSYIDLGECSYIGSEAFRQAGKRNTSPYIRYMRLGYTGSGSVSVHYTAFSDTNVYSLWVPCWKYSLYSDFSYLSSNGQVVGYYYISVPDLDYTTGRTGLGWSGWNDWLPSSVISNMTTMTTDATYLNGYNDYSDGICHDAPKLERVTLPHCSYIGANSFENCSKLRYVSMPEIQVVKNTAFKNCTSLSSITLNKCWNLSDEAFRGCKNLTTVKLGKGVAGSRVCTLGSSSVFAGCTNLAYIYVPTSLYSDYISANRWSNYSNIIYSY